jgi:hypothetical protein
MEHDYRDDIVERKHNKEYWGKWHSWNILYKTLTYETSSSGHVEGYGYIRKSLEDFYDEHLIEYVGNGYTFDIMNGWWNCFKVLFNLNSSRKNEETKSFIENIKKEIVDIEEKDDLKKYISQNYFLEEETVQCFLDFLEVVYTCGNIAPVPKGANKHADNWDSWEYKLNSPFLKYKRDDYKEYFHFEQYQEENFKINDEDKENSICKYLSERVQLIKKRGSFYTNRSKM